MGHTILQTGKLVVQPVPRMDISIMCTIELVGALSSLGCSSSLLGRQVMSIILSDLMYVHF
jgi:hypothetical protein